MRVSTAKPFQIIYSLFQHEYLGFLFESFVVQLDEKNRLTLAHQNISFKNANEFSSQLDNDDYELIKLMDSTQQDAIIKKFNKKKIKPQDFFLKIYDKEKGNSAIAEEIENYLERKRAQILPLLSGKNVFEMGSDGEPTWKRLNFMEKRATVLFHFRRNDDNTHYFPTIKHDGRKVEFQYSGAYLVCKHPAWLVVNNNIYHFEKDVDGQKLIPFLNKKFIVIPQKVEEQYFRKFVAPLVASFDVYATGFEIKSERPLPKALLSISELVSNADNLTLFNGNGNGKNGDNGHHEEGKMVFDLSFKYGDKVFSSQQLNPVSVDVEKINDSYVFHRVRRNNRIERSILDSLRERGLPLKNAKLSLPKGEAFAWILQNKSFLEELEIDLIQNPRASKKYFIGHSSISLEIKENIDWFDINAIVRFGEYEIPFKQLRKMILNNRQEIRLPNGEIAVIPETWFKEYSELFAFLDDERHPEQELTLHKHHVSLVQDLHDGNLARVTMSRKLEKLRDFSEVEDHEMPGCFKGTLRPYQKAGYNWLLFLEKYRFGGCLADDMGLGKTVQTLAMLQNQKESGQVGTSLLVMPTSLIYNWEMEARKFTPQLKVFNYTGTTRIKDTKMFSRFDLVLTSYGIVRLDIDILKDFYFNYVILDESQVIKNPDSNIAKAVRTLHARQRLILTGTPLENSTMDIWSQMSFINPGLLGNKTFFKNQFLNPIEKKQDEGKTKKLNSIIKPFILRRHKSQVAKDLPPKVENVQYCSMTSLQEEKYEEAKSFFRNKILDEIDKNGLGGSQFLLLQGLTKLRQIANHPKMVDPSYSGDSGKMEDVVHNLHNAIQEGHKVLVFSQFVKHLSLFREHLKEQNIDFAYLDGSSKDRKCQVERFQNEEKLKVFLISLKAGGLGLNLTKADYVFILDPWWNPAVEAQAVDRAHRIGQENQVFTYKFITKDTLEEKILALQQKKLELANNLITTEESFIKRLNKEDIEALLT